MVDLTGKFFNRSSLGSNRGGYEDGSVAKFQDYSVSNENPVGDRGSYRGGLMFKAKMLMLLPLFFLASACANLNPYDFLGAAIQYRAADPKANLTDSQRLGGGIAGSLIRDSGKREYDKELMDENPQKTMSTADKVDILYNLFKRGIITKEQYNEGISSIIN